MNVHKSRFFLDHAEHLFTHGKKLPQDVTVTKKIDPFLALKKMMNDQLASFVHLANRKDIYIYYQKVEVTLYSRESLFLEILNFNLTSLNKLIVSIIQPTIALYVMVHAEQLR
jgi:hypothetical protein